MELIKTCTKCGVEKIATKQYFVLSKKVKSGIGSQCRACANFINSKKASEKRAQLKIEKFSTTHKKCIKCEISFPRNNQYFSVRKTSMDGLRNECRQCLNKHKNSKRDREAGKIRAKEYREFLKQNNPEKFKEISNKQSENVKRYRLLGVYPNGETVKQVRQRNSVTRYKKIKSCEFESMKFSIRGLILTSIKKQGWSKKTKTHQILGCSYEEFKSYIESKFVDGMNWSNHGRGKDKWHYDHIFPMSSATTEKDVYRLNHYTNFQPLWEEDNLRKSDKISEEWGNA